MRTERAALVVGVFALVLAGVVCSAPATARAQEGNKSYSTLVVQNRKYNSTHEFGLGFGVLPLDAFTKGLTVSGGYTLHFTDNVAWEVAQFFYSFHVDTDLKKELAAFDLRPTPFEVVNYYLTSNFVWSPLYWKGAWLNRSLAHGEFFLLAGGGYGWFTRSKRPAADLGLGFRFYTSDLISFRLDARYLWFFGDNILKSFDVKDEIWIGLGSAISL